MNLEQYQEKMIKLWKYTLEQSLEEQVLFCCVGMAEEAGEAMGKIKRKMRGEIFSKEEYLKEIGDVLAYWIMAYTSASQLTKFQLGLLNSNVTTGLVTHNGILKETVTLFAETYYILDNVVGQSFEAIEYYLFDVFHAIRGCTYSVESTLSEVMELNILKLEDRMKRNGTLRGSGDNR